MAEFFLAEYIAKFTTQNIHVYNVKYLNKWNLSNKNFQALQSDLPIHKLCKIFTGLIDFSKVAGNSHELRKLLANFTNFVKFFLISANIVRFFTASTNFIKVVGESQEIHKVVGKFYQLCKVVQKSYKLHEVHSHFY